MIIWSNKELPAAALTLPGIVGWSGTVESQRSKLVLNWSQVPITVSLSSLGMQLNSLAPLTCSEDSLAISELAANQRKLQVFIFKCDLSFKFPPEFVINFQRTLLVF